MTSSIRVVGHVVKHGTPIRNTGTARNTEHESKIDDSISDNEIKIPGYALCRNDRNRNGGGVVLYIRDCFSFIQRKELIPNQLEMVCIEICRKYGKLFLISAWYRPPNSNIDLFDSFEMFINKCEIESKELLVLRYLNCDSNKTPLDSHTQKLKNICVLYQLSQIIDEPTRVTKFSATQIDLILAANNPESISNHGVIEIGISDHSLIYAVKKLVPLKGQRTCSEVRNFKNFNERLFLHDLSRIPWDCVNQFNNPNDSQQVWKSFFIEVPDRHAPILRKYIKTTRIPWLNASIKQLMRQRDFHEMMFKKINSEMHF